MPMPSMFRFRRTATFELALDRYIRMYNYNCNNIKMELELWDNKNRIKLKEEQQQL